MNRGNMRRRTTGLIAAAALVVAACGIGGFFGYRAIAAHQATEAGCARVDQWKSDMSPYLEVGKGERTTFILGDSYSAGDDLTDRKDGWVYKYAAQTGDRVLVNSIGYTGYIAGGYCGHDQFGTRVGAVVASQPVRIIVQGGLNDVGSDSEDVADAASELIDELDGYAQVILVGPPHAPQRASGEQAIDRALSGVAADKDIQYVSTYGWKLDYNPAGLHLTKRGHADFATNVAAATS
ncbi:SGNH/GDSL hydrolase family protein [Curtobacterium sp. MCLR17_034]|uniref:SGNH/GDSL hydrolase family protein n=1 Tax=Curtobacterium sp. MCLR17_034 TaxID=2175623 RepID=UPI000DA86603|nr:SGNH/GDSL hydrolase family protein [Curtobacterium sp. MCLR17_034]PZF11781.1 hypothetical protein DEI98_06580 [Curtobacterium sp. MCLR17_034]